MIIHYEEIPISKAEINHFTWYFGCGILKNLYYFIKCKRIEKKNQLN